MVKELVNNGAPKTTVELMHTPGPWFADPPGTGTIGSIVTSDGDCVAQAMQILPRDEDPMQEARKANARLIASAPDLLAALMQIAAWDDLEGNDYLANHGSYAGFDEPGAVKIAREALARLLNK